MTPVPVAQRPRPVAGNLACGPGGCVRRDEVPLAPLDLGAAAMTVGFSRSASGGPVIMSRTTVERPRRSRPTRSRNRRVRRLITQVCSACSRLSAPASRVPAAARSGLDYRSCPAPANAAVDQAQRPGRVAVQIALCVLDEGFLFAGDSCGRSHFRPQAVGFGEPGDPRSSSVTGSSWPSRRSAPDWDRGIIRSRPEASTLVAFSCCTSLAAAGADRHQDSRHHDVVLPSNAPLPPPVWGRYHASPYLDDAMVRVRAAVRCAVAIVAVWPRGECDAADA